MRMTPFSSTRRTTGWANSIQHICRLDLLLNSQLRNKSVFLHSFCSAKCELKTSAPFLDVFVLKRTKTNGFDWVTPYKMADCRTVASPSLGTAGSAGRLGRGAPRWPPVWRRRAIRSGSLGKWALKPLRHWSTWKMVKIAQKNYQLSYFQNTHGILILSHLSGVRNQDWPSCQEIPKNSFNLAHKNLNKIQNTNKLQMNMYIDAALQKNWYFSIGIRRSTIRFNPTRAHHPVRKPRESRKSPPH